MSDQVIHGLKCRKDNSGYVQLDSRPRLPLGLFEGLTDGERTAILLDPLGRKVRVLLDIDCVATA